MNINALTKDELLRYMGTLSDLTEREEALLNIISDCNDDYIETYEDELHEAEEQIDDLERDVIALKNAIEKAKDILEDVC